MKLLVNLCISIILVLVFGFTSFASENTEITEYGPHMELSEVIEGTTLNISENNSNSGNEEVLEATNKLNYSDEDLKYMIMVLTGECQDMPYEVQLEYASVVMNRKNDPSYPNTIKGVCLQRGQYSCFKDGNAYRTPTSMSIEAAKYILANGSISPANVVYQSYGRQGSGIYKQIGKEKFCFK